MGLLTVERRKAVWRDRARAYSVTIDGQAVGKLASGETATFDLSPGPHQVRMKLDWCGSRTITVNGGEDTNLVCDAGGSAFMAGIHVLFRPGEYLSLTRN